MKHVAYLSIVLLICSSGLLSCGQVTGSEVASEPNPVSNKAFNEYWYGGTAELSSFTLQQARYGEVHEGEAVLIFVTEPFSESKQVKLDDGNANPGDRVDVLKLNFSKKFNTGLYPYSLMASVFTPVDQLQHPRSLKLTATCQDWCGHTFTQLNLGKEKWKAVEYSYFEMDGDRTWELSNAMLEDEVWNQLRINPQALPTGEVQMIPGVWSTRLRHIAMEVETANAVLTDHPIDASLQQYKLTYPKLDRELVISFGKEFPYEIQGWEETYVSGWGDGAKKLTTTAVRKTTIKTDYWDKHDVADAEWRDKLMLD